VSILERLFKRRQKPPRCAIVAGNGQFNLYVASLSQQRMELERLYRARTGDPYRLPALLIPQPTSARGTDTVAVRVGDTTVGFLLHTAALEFLTALHASEFHRAACAAMIVVRPDLQLGNQAFRLRLDAEVPFKLADPVNQVASNQKGGHKSGLGSAA
jgi:hypothetical protein